LAGAHAAFIKYDFIDDIKEMISEFKIKISALGAFHNYLDPNPALRKQNFAELKNAIDCAAELGIPVVTCFAGQNDYLNYEGNIKLFKEEWVPWINYAAEKKINIGIENCPAKGRYDIGGQNLMASPGVWGEIFQFAPKNFGLNFDPSHLIWQMADPLISIDEFSERIFHVHIKDTLINRDQLNFVGVYGMGIFKYRLPGRGEIDWNQLLGKLKEVGYKGTLSIEHEDSDFYASDAKRKEGLLIAKRYLEERM